MSGDLTLSGDASFSPCGTYRYWLSRRWGNGPTACFVMLNPSTATADVNDPTITRCIGFAQRWKMDGLSVVNLFAYRATKPAEMKKVDDPVGLDNDRFILAACQSAWRDGGVIVAAWGADGKFKARDERVITLLEDHDMRVKALRVTMKTGQPEHPLYVPYDINLQEYRGRVVALAGA